MALSDLLIRKQGVDVDHNSGCKAERLTKHWFSEKMAEGHFLVAFYEDLSRGN